MTGGGDPLRRAAGLSLRLGCAVQSAALASKAFAEGSSIDSVLFVNAGFAEGVSRGIDRLVVGSAAVAGLVLVLGPLVPGPRGRGRRAIDVGASALVVAAFLAVALAMVVAGGRSFSELAPGAHGTRWLAPVALALLVVGDASRAPTGARRVLRIAVAATFAVHGWEALHLNPPFLDLVFGASRRLGNTDLREADVHGLLRAIGVMDLTLAAVLLRTRLAAFAAWAAAWGGITAASRIFALGPEFAAETFLRAMNSLAPLALVFLLVAVAREREARGGGSTAAPSR